MLNGTLLKMAEGPKHILARCNHRGPRGDAQPKNSGRGRNAHHIRRTGGRTSQANASPQIILKIQEQERVCTDVAEEKLAYRKAKRAVYSPTRQQGGGHDSPFRATSILWVTFDLQRHHRVSAGPDHHAAGERNATRKVVSGYQGPTPKGMIAIFSGLKNLRRGCLRMDKGSRRHLVSGLAGESSRSSGHPPPLLASAKGRLKNLDGNDAGYRR